MYFQSWGWHFSLGGKLWWLQDVLTLHWSVIQLATPIDSIRIFDVWVEHHDTKHIIMTVSFSLLVVFFILFIQLRVLIMHINQISCLSHLLLFPLHRLGPWKCLDWFGLWVVTRHRSWTMIAASLSCCSSNGRWSSWIRMSSHIFRLIINNFDK